LRLKTNLASEDEPASAVQEETAGVEPGLRVSAETRPSQRAGAARIEPESVARIEHGPHVCAETARRLACDSGLVTMTRDRSGNVLDVGRRRRTVPAAIRRALDVRDRGCRFPGCMSRYCDAHHVTPWVDGGETKLDNLVLLCRHHHRRVHEGGWRVTLCRRAGAAPGATNEVRFHRPDGGLLPYVPPRATLPEEPAYDLERENDRIGIEIGPWTATPRWLGERMDVDWALSTLGNSAAAFRSRG